MQKEAAIKQMLKSQFPDIVKDKIGGSRYDCFSSKCRKTFPSLKPLLEHQKIHVSVTTLVLSNLIVFVAYIS